jgi:hypothetical protein
MHEFLIAPSTDRAMWFIFLVPGLILLLVMGLLGAAVGGARSARFEVSPGLVPITERRKGTALPHGHESCGLSTNDRGLQCLAQSG